MRVAGAVFARLFLLASCAFPTILSLQLPASESSRCVPIPSQFDSVVTKSKTRKKNFPTKYVDRVSYERRSFFAGAFAVASAVAATVLSNPADAAVIGAKGAAEYDMEYYLRDILKGNTREGNLPASAAPPAPPSRELSGALLPLLLDNACTDDCIPVRVLSKVSGYSPTIVSEKAVDYRSKSSKAFALKSKWNSEDVSDQYYFDITSYALWRTAAELIPDYEKRDKFARDVGRNLYKEAKKSGLLNIPSVMSVSTKGKSDDFKKTSKETIEGKSKNSDSSDSTNDVLIGPLTGTIPAVLEVLELFNSTRYFTSYRLGGDDPSRSGRLVFDELDDEDIADGASVNCLVSIYRPATLGAALQITGEGSRFSPDFVGNTLLALWEDAGISGSFESYFVDPEYRPNPKDFFPDEQLLQFTLKKK